MLLAVMAVLTVWANHPWLSRVYAYRPAPGQFINTMPIYRMGEPYDSVLSRCQSDLCGRIDTTTEVIAGVEYTRIDTVINKSGMVSLGGFGGYIIVGFDHPVVNTHDYDFEIMGNAFYSSAYDGGGSCEPGIVVVGVDEDGDGVPSDGDKWYELAGSEYNHPTTQHDYTITYYRPDESKVRTPSLVDRNLNDTTYIRWTSNDVNSDSTSGYMSRNIYHHQPYWPMWLNEEETLTFSGAKLRCNVAFMEGDGSYPYFLLQNFAWGYVDNLPNKIDSIPQPDGYYNPGFKIDWAVDEDGNHVNLSHIDFIKVYSAQNQYCGSIGETSTEVTGGIDYHPDAVMPNPLVGDVNGDGEVTVSDVNMTIDIIQTGGYSAAADVDGDGEVGLGDINAVIGLILQ